MLARTVCILLAFLAVCSPLAAQEEPKSKAAKEALAQYEKNVAEARKTYDAYHAEALKILIGFLDEARRRALEDNDLDEAQRIVAKIKEAEEALKNQVPPSATQKFEIIAARWGAEESWADVTKSVLKRVKAGRLSIPLPHNAFAVDDMIPDPKPNSFKSVVIVYSHNGRVQVLTCRANQAVSLPK